MTAPRFSLAAIAILGLSGCAAAPRPVEAVRAHEHPILTGTVQLEGLVARPGTYNLPQSGIDVTRLLKASGGLMDAPVRVIIERQVDAEFQTVFEAVVIDLTDRASPSTPLLPGDRISVSALTERTGGLPRTADEFHAGVDEDESNMLGFFADLPF